MIAADSSSLIDFLEGMTREDCLLIEQALQNGSLRLPPIVLTEILSDVVTANKFGIIQNNITLLEVMPGYWQRAGIMREKIIRQGLKAKLPDTLIAQSCIDYHMPLIACDSDFDRFVPYGLKLAVKR